MQDRLSHEGKLPSRQDLIAFIKYYLLKLSKFKKKKLAYLSWTTVWDVVILYDTDVHTGATTNQLLPQHGCKTEYFVNAEISVTTLEC